MVRYKNLQIRAEKALEEVPHGRYRLMNFDETSDWITLSVEHEVFGPNVSYLSLNRSIDEDSGEQSFIVSKVITLWGNRKQGLAKVLITRVLELAEAQNVKKICFPGNVLQTEIRYRGMTSTQYESFIKNFSYDGEIVFYDN